jgi:hypothetical protein
MATYKDFAVSGVWFDGNSKGEEHLTHVMLHKVSKHNKILKGVKTERKEFIELLQSNIIYTLAWNYKEGRWKWCSLVVAELKDENYILKTESEDLRYNELINLINMNIQPV